MTTSATLSTLISVVKRGPGEKELVCPRCGDTIKLKFGRLGCCSMACTWEGHSLQELAVRGTVGVQTLDEDEEDHEGAS